MTEFWERFAFYGIRWALVLYIVAQFHGGNAAGEAPANLIYGAYLALVYAAAIFGGYVADRVLGYQRSILLGAVIMAAGLFMISMPDPERLQVRPGHDHRGNGLFKPNISTMVGKLYATDDNRRDAGFTIFYMGINLGGFLAPILTGILADKIFGTQAMPAYKVVFIASGIGMLISLVWFWFGRRQLAGIGRPPEGDGGKQKVLYVFIGALAAIPVVYFLLSMGAGPLNWYVLLRDVRRALHAAAGRGHPRRQGAARQGDRDADHLRLQHPVLDVLRAGGQLVHLPRRQDRRPRHLRTRRLRVLECLVPVGEFAGDHRPGPGHRADLGVDGQAQHRAHRSRASSASA